MGFLPIDLLRPGADFEHLVSRLRTSRSSSLLVNRRTGVRPWLTRNSEDLALRARADVHTGILETTASVS